MECDVLIIGAGPSGAVAGAFLNKAGINCLVVEKEKFPRFVIGESLLPNCNNILREAGLLDDVINHGFQFKNGAAFSWGDKYTYFDFCDKTSSGDGTTFQVQRAEFDKVLIQSAIKNGLNCIFEVSVEQIDFNAKTAILAYKNGEKKNLKYKFIIDASGYGRVLPRMLDLEVDSALSSKTAYFTHIQDNISEVLYDRNKILITTHPDFREVWFWLLPFSNGRCSIGVVGEKKFIEISGASFEEILKHHVYRAPMLKRILNNAVWDTPVRSISGYSKDVKQFYGSDWILLGNASEFLDPVFSSGVTIALVSAKMASECVIKILNGEKIDLEKSYAKPLKLGIDCFRTYVNGWYSGKFQDVIYAKTQNHQIKRQICSILAGYAWDEKNPFVVKSQSALDSVAAYI